MQEVRSSSSPPLSSLSRFIRRMSADSSWYARYAQSAEDDESRSVSGPEDEDESSSGNGYLVPNGRGDNSGRPSSRNASLTQPASSSGGGGGGILPPDSGVPTSSSHHQKNRSASSTVHDRSKNGPSFSVSSPSQQHGSAGQQQQMTLGGGSSSSSKYPSSSPNSNNNNNYPLSAYASQHDRHASAKESFLNYFFGGAGGVGGPGGSSGAGGGDHGLIGGGGHNGTTRRTEAAGSNPMSGRKGLEGNAAAYEMKSLEKHLEPVRFPFLLLLLPPSSFSPHLDDADLLFANSLAPSLPRSPAVPLNRYNPREPLWPDRPSRDGDVVDQGVDCELLWDYEADDSGFGAEGDHACVPPSPFSVPPPLPLLSQLPFATLSLFPPIGY